MPLCQSPLCSNSSCHCVSLHYKAVYANELLLLLKKFSSARLGESDIHPISPKTPAPQYQLIDRKKRKGKREEDYSWDREAYANKEALAMLLKPASPTPSKTELARSFQRDTEKGIKVMLYCKVLQRGCA